MQVTSETYPQMGKLSSGGAEVGGAVGLAAFKRGENALFHRATKLSAVCQSKYSLHLKCEAKAYRNRTCWTHETSLHQFAEEEGAREGVLDMEITFWSSEVFRVRYGREVWTTPAGSLLPRETGMLVGEPSSEFSLTLEELDSRWIVRTPVVALHIQKDPFCLHAVDRQGRVFWQQKRAELFTADVFEMAISEQDDRTACFESFSLSGDEEIFGLGERFDHVPRTGRAVDFWNKDAVGATSPRTYINVPFFLSTRGYGLFLNTSTRTEWEIGTLDAFTVGFACEDVEMDYFVIYGPAPADILRNYAKLTGFSPTPPVWSFGLWMSRNSYTSWDLVHEIARQCRQQGIPADVLHLDTAWFQEDWNCDLRFSPERFQDPKENIERLRREGFRISLWQYNFVPSRADNLNYLEGLARGYFAKDVEGNVFRHPPHRQGSWMDDAIIDFSNPEAVAWYGAQIEALMRLGVSSVKTDFGEGIPEEAVFHSIAGRRFHNLYSLVYNAAVAGAVKRVSGEDIVWARSGTAGSQRYPVHWGGDSQCSFSGLAGTLRAALSLGLSGFPFFSHDIGGFIGRPEAELYIRWAQFGLFSSHARCHGCGNDNSREPWAFGAEASDIFRKYAVLRYRLLPYIYNEARRSSASAKPMIRALVIEWPQDRNVWQIQDQYLFGDSLLIAPVLQPLSVSAVRQIYLPAGRWIDFWTKRSLDSKGEWILREVDLATMPIFVKAGTLLPYGNERLFTDNVIGPISDLEIYSGAIGCLDYDDGEKRFCARWSDGALEFEGTISQPRVTVFG